jgi:DNA-binding CsgD family transcriptional regulator
VVVRAEQSGPALVPGKYLPETRRTPTRIAGRKRHSLCIGACECKGGARRLHILQLLAEDYQVMQIVALTGLSDRGVDWELGRLKELSGCVNNTGLVAWAFRKGIVK